MFITFGVLCIGAAAQVFFTYDLPVSLLNITLRSANPGRYPETCGKTIEEVEEMFSKGGPKPWNTKPGHSRLDSRIEEAREKNLRIEQVGAHGVEEKSEGAPAPAPAASGGVV